MTQADFIGAILDPERPIPSGLKTWNGSDPAQRFAVYRNNVVVTLIDALASSFPAVRRLVGEEFFAAMAGHFVRMRPPISPILTEYGRGFAAFVAEFPPVAHLTYLSDVAKLEYAMIEAYHAADAMPAGAELLAGLSPESLETLRFTFHPSLRLVFSDFAIVTLVEANRADNEPPPINAGIAEDALVIRQGLEVRLARLRGGSGAFLDALRGGSNLSAAASAGARASPEFDLAAAITMLFELSLVTSVITDPPTIDAVHHGYGR